MKWILAMAQKMQHPVFSFDHDMECEIDLTPKKMKSGERKIEFLVWWLMQAPAVSANGIAANVLRANGKLPTTHSYLIRVAQ